MHNQEVDDKFLIAGYRSSRRPSLSYKPCNNTAQFLALLSQTAWAIAEYFESAQKQQWEQMPLAELTFSLKAGGSWVPPVYKSE